MQTRALAVVTWYCCLAWSVAGLAAQGAEIDPGWGDFSLNLCESVAPPNHVWVGSGWTTVNPTYATVMGVGGFFSPPLACGDFEMSVALRANEHNVRDAYVLGRPGILQYSGGTWKPQGIVRRGTYHKLFGDQLLSFAVESTLVPLYGQAGFLVKASFTNRAATPLALTVHPSVQAGSPSVVPLKNWGLSPPRGGSPAKPVKDGEWASGQVRLTLLAESLTLELPPKASGTAWLAIVATQSGKEPRRPARLADWEAETVKAWNHRMAWALRNVPVMETDIPGLAEYYRRSIVSGLVSIWENPAFAMNPHWSTCGMDGGAVCSYLWDVGGYSGGMMALQFGAELKPLVGRMAALDLRKFYALAPDGSGVGVGYSYSPAALTHLVWQLARHDKPDRALFELVRKVVLDAEVGYPFRNGLLDYGGQENLLEMRSAGYEHFVPSPNADRAWCLDRLAEMGAVLGQDARELRAWRTKADEIRAAVKRELWDPQRKWFKCLYPDGHVEFVYSIQMLTVLRAMPDDAELRQGLLSHLRPGAFLASHGVQSVSREDRVHFEVLDTDWGGGGAYVSTGPELAALLYDIGEADRAWDVLRRFFWMGAMLPYYPQEMLADRPATPAHKRANEIGGLTHAQAVLFGLAGFDPRVDGSLWIHPHPPADGHIALKGYRLHDHVVDLYLEPRACRVVLDGREVYAGRPRQIEVWKKP